MDACKLTYKEHERRAYANGDTQLAKVIAELYDASSIDANELVWLTHQGEIPCPTKTPKTAT